jgi:hypothetical protein
MREREQQIDIGQLRTQACQPLQVRLSQELQIALLSVTEGNQVVVAVRAVGHNLREFFTGELQTPPKIFFSLRDIGCFCLGRYDILLGLVLLLRKKLVLEERHLVDVHSLTVTIGLV